MSCESNEIGRLPANRSGRNAGGGNSAPFTASETFDLGVDLGSPVSRDYFERRPFKFDGKIDQVTVELK